MKALILRFAFFALMSCCGVCASADEPLPDSQITGLAASIQRDMDTSTKWVSWNQKLDVTAKLVVFLLAVTAAIGAAKAATMTTVPPKLKMLNTALASITTLVTAVAFTQFDFAKRQAIWERRYHALEACSVALKFRKPDHLFFEQLEHIRRWGDMSSLSELNASCNATEPRSRSALLDTAPSARPEAPARSPLPQPSKPAGT